MMLESLRTLIVNNDKAENINNKNYLSDIIYCEFLYLQ